MKHTSIFVAILALGLAACAQGNTVFIDADVDPCSLVAEPCVAGTAPACSGGILFECTKDADNCDVRTFTDCAMAGLSCQDIGGVSDCVDLCAGVDCSAGTTDCAVSACDPATGMCELTDEPDGTICNDLNACSDMDMCRFGACVGVNICAFYYFEDFEASDGGWTTGGITSWAHGAPSGGLVDPGTGNLWATNLAGPYLNGENGYVESPVLDFSGSSEDALLSFDHFFVTETSFDEGWLDMSIDGGVIWTRVGTAGQGTNWYNQATNNWWVNNSSGWRLASILLVGVAGQADVRLRFYFSSDGSVTYPGFGFDNILIQESTDLEATSVTVAADCPTASDALVVNVRNRGSTTISDFDLEVIVDGGSPVLETITTTVLPGQSVAITTTATFALGTSGTHTLSARVTAFGDSTPGNDTATNSVEGLLVMGSRYSEDFENGPGGWSAGGITSWALGTPTGAFISAAASGTMAWVTNPAGLYGNNETGYVQSLCLDMSATVDDPVLSFSHIFDAPTCCDEGYFEIWTAGTGVWTKLGDGTTGINWYNDLISRWWDGPSGSPGTWRTASIPLTGAAGQSAVRIRHVFSSDTGGNSEGFGLDDVVIEEFTDLEATSVTTRAGACPTAAEQLTINVNNLGSSTIAGFDVELIVDAGAPVIETFTAVVAPGQSLAITTTTTFDLSAIGTHSLFARVIVLNDNISGNDTATGSVDSEGLVVLGGGYSEDFETGPGGWVAEGFTSWAWGTPTGTFITGAASGTRAWVTNPAGLYNNSETGSVQSLCFDFSAVGTDPTLSFSQIFTTEASFDEGWMEVWTATSGTWTRLGDGTMGTNWYNDLPNRWWDGTTGVAGVWRTATHVLTGTAGEASVRVRHVFSSDGSVTFEGFGLDLVQITP